TQQGRVRDDAGNWFGCDNSTIITHHVLDDHYLRRNPHVVYPNMTVHIDAPPHKLFSRKSDAQRFKLSGPPNTVTAACGLGIYRDDLLGPQYSGNSFTCAPVNLLGHRCVPLTSVGSERVNRVVHGRVLKPSGSTFTAVRAPEEAQSEFLASTDNWF